MQNKELFNPIEIALEESEDSCPKCGNPLLTMNENGQLVKKCMTESFDVASKTVISCGYIKML